MRLPRLSVNAILAAVAVIAIDCMAYRSIHSRPEFLYLPSLLDLIIAGSVPMVNILAFGLVLLLRRGGRSRWFWIGFEVGGGIALCTFVGLALVKPGAIESCVVWIFDDLGERTGWDMTSPAWAIAEEVSFPILLGFPQLVVALAGGGLTALIRGHSGALPAVEPPPRRLRLGIRLIPLILAAAPALLVEGLLRWQVDPGCSRLEAGTRAIFDVGGSVGFGGILPNQPYYVLPNRSEVRVEGDHEPSSVGPTGPGGTGPLGDRRRVRVTLLDGAEAGSQVRLQRCFIRIVR